MRKQHLEKILFLAFAASLFGALMFSSRGEVAAGPKRNLDARLQALLYRNGFTGRIESSLETRLGRPVNLERADLGRLLWFDTITGLNDDNTCGGCHSPTNGFGDTQSIAIGIENNGIVGPHRDGPRNMRRTPMVMNNAFYPNLMWNSRFQALSGDPFDNRAGFLFPPPEGLSLSNEPHLLAAQAFIPPTERTEVAGFDFQGDNDAIRAEVLARLNGIPAYRQEFAKTFPQINQGQPIDFDMFGKAIAEFEFSLTYANAPIDRFARGESGALTETEKKGAMLFFGRARCVECHSVAGKSNEMFSDFQDHVAGVPQIVPVNTNNVFDGNHANQDYGLEEITGNSSDRYKFRTSPLRNIALQATFMHNGAFTRLGDAIRYHLDATAFGQTYSPADYGLDADLRGPMGPLAPVLKRLDPRLRTRMDLTVKQVDQLIAFVGHGLLDPRAVPQKIEAACS